MVQRVALGLFLVLVAVVSLGLAPVPEWVVGIAAGVAGIAVWMGV